MGRRIETEERVVAVEYFDQEHKDSGGAYCSVQAMFREDDDGVVEASFVGACGTFVTERELGLMKEEYWQSVDIEDEYNYMWEEHAKTYNITEPEEPEKPENGLKELFYDDDMRRFQEQVENYKALKRLYFDDLERQLGEDDFPYEVLTREGDYAFTTEGVGQIKNNFCKSNSTYKATTDADWLLDSVCAMWDAWHGKEVSEDQTDKIQRLMPLFPTFEEFAKQLEVEI